MNDLVEQHDFEESLRLAESLIQRVPDWKELNLNKIEILAKGGHSQRAKSLLSDLSAELGPSSELHFL